MQPAAHPAVDVLLCISGHKRRECGLLGSRIANGQTFMPTFDGIHCSRRSG
jgi:hypothetical protein